MFVCCLDLMEKMTDFMIDMVFLRQLMNDRKKEKEKALRGEDKKDHQLP